MSTNAKIYLAVGVLLAAVFGVTVIGRSVPVDSPGGGPAPTGGTPGDEPTGELLRYKFDLIEFNPTSDKAVFREYPGYFERNDHLVPFWFCNPNPVPVRMTFLDTSCSACSFAEIAVAPTPQVDADADAEPFGAVAGGVVGRTPVTSTDPVPFGLDALQHRERTRLYQQIPADKWQRVVARDKGTVVEFPAAAAPDKPTWGVIRLNIKVNESKVLRATIGLQKPDMTLPVPVEFKAAVVLAPLCDVFPGQITFPDLGEKSPPLTDAIYYFSYTRPTDGEVAERLPPPLVPSAKGDPFLTFGEPVPLTADERAALADALFAARKVPHRVVGGYRIPVVLKRFAEDPDRGNKTREIDLGPAERTVAIAPKSGLVDVVPKVVIRSHAVGAVALDRAAGIDFGQYRTADGVPVKTVKLVADRPGLELEPVQELCDPPYLTIQAVSPPKTDGDRTTWTLQLKIPPGNGGRLKPGSVVVLRIKSTGQLIRLPTTGNGSS